MKFERPGPGHPRAGNTPLETARVEKRSEVAPCSGCCSSDNGPALSPKAYDFVATRKLQQRVQYTNGLPLSTIEQAHSLCPNTDADAMTPRILLGRAAHLA